MSASIRSTLRPAAAASRAIARAVVDFPSPARLLVIASVLRRAVLRRQLHRSADRLVGLRNVRREVDQLENRLRPLQARDHAEQRNAEALLDLVRIADAVAEGLERRDRRQCNHQPGEKRQDDVDLRIGRDRQKRRLGAVDDRNVVRGDARFGADFLVALEKPIVEFAVGIDLALQDVVADPERLLGERVALQAVDGALELRFLRLRGLILVADRVADAGRERSSSACRARSVRRAPAARPDGRASGAGGPAGTAPQLRPLLRELLDRRDCEDVGQVHQRRRLTPAASGPAPGCASPGRGERLVELDQARAGERVRRAVGGSPGSPPPALGSTIPAERA